MKSNAYVYPSEAYKDLSGKLFSNFPAGEKNITFAQIVTATQAIPVPKILIKGKTVVEKVLSIFLDSHIRFGQRDFITDHRAYWLDKFNYFVAQNKPIEATLLGFPFKMQVPLKTRRALPDMGEVLVLQRLYQLTQLVGQVYAPGLHITLFTEGGLGKIAGISTVVTDQYHNRVVELVKQLGYAESISVQKLGDMERLPGFAAVYRRCYVRNKELLLVRQPEFMSKYQAVLGPITRLLPAAQVPIGILMDVYNPDLDDVQCASRVLQIRQSLRKCADQVIVRYFSYLETRDELDFLNKKVPGYCALTVSPKPKRLGILPISKEVTILPYHGVPVYDEHKHVWDVRYLIDIQRDQNRRYVAVHLEGDRDSEPFYYSARRRRD